MRQAVGYSAALLLASFGCGGNTTGPTIACGAGTIRAGNECQPVCGAGAHYDKTKRACVADVVCGSGTQATDGQCVPQCQPGFLLHGGQCEPDCGAGTHQDSDTGKCLADVSCGPGTQANASGQCVPAGETCGSGTHQDPSTGTCLPDATCGQGTHAVGASCVPDSDACGTGTHLDVVNEVCIPDLTCGPGTQELNEQCVPECSPAELWNGTLCVAACGNGTHADQTSGVCLGDVSCGPGTQVDSAGQCVPQSQGGGAACGTGTHLDQATNTCEPDATCGTGTHLVGGTCQPTAAVCGAGTYFDQASNTCKPNNTCGPGTVVKTGQCVPVCQAGTYWDNTKSTCMASCGAGTSLDTTTGKCVPNGAACALGSHFDSTTHTCVPDDTCGTGTHDVSGQCVLICPAGEYYDAPTNTCQANCGNGTVLDSSGKVCVGTVTCGTGTTLDTANNTCVANTGSGVQCGTGTYLDGATQTCLPSATCSDSTTLVDGKCVPNAQACGAGTYLDTTSNSCLAIATCGPGTVAESGQCVPACSPAQYWDTQSAKCVSACGAGTHLDSSTNTCAADVVCGTGTQDDGSGQCVPSTAACGQGAELSNGVCISDVVCEPGTKAVGTTCVMDASACQAGTHIDSTGTQCLPDVTCGTNTKAVDGQCVLSLGGDGATGWHVDASGNPQKNVQVSATKDSDGTPLVAFDPQLAAATQTGGGADVYIAYQTRHGTGDAASDIYLGASTDDGATWKQKAFHCSDSTFPSCDHLGDAAVAAAGTSAVAVFIDFHTAASGGGSDLFLTTTTDGGTTWATPTNASAAAAFSSTTLLSRPFVFLAGTTTVVSFTADTTGGQTRILKIAAGSTLMSHALNGASYGGFAAESPLVETSGGDLYGLLDSGSSSELHRLEIMTGPASDSAAFTRAGYRESDQTDVNTFGDLEPWLAINKADSMVALWRYNSGGSTHIATTTSDVFGTATSLVKLDDAPAGVAVDCASPVVVADSSGNFHALWMDDRYGSWAPYSSSSTDGKTWTASTQVSDQLFDESGAYDPTTGETAAFLGRYDSIAAGGTHLYAAWTDTRNGASQVFFEDAANPFSSP